MTRTTNPFAYEQRAKYAFGVFHKLICMQYDKIADNLSCNMTDAVRTLARIFRELTRRLSLPVPDMNCTIFRRRFSNVLHSLT